MSGALEKDARGNAVGADPRRLSVDELAEAGHVPRPIMKVVREKCRDCVCGVDSEIRKCVAVDCPLWPYRMGKNPFSRRKGNPGNLAKARARRAA